MTVLKDMTGMKIGYLLILSRAENRGKRRTCWNAKCDCGSDFIVATDDLTSGDTKSCGCLRKDLLRIDLLGKKFGKLIVIDKAKKRGKSTSQFWKCKCECGNFHVASAQHLSLGRINSCGCWFDENISNETKERFFSNVEKTEYCWNWIGYTTKGYGIFFHTKQIRASRFSYILHFGKIQKEKLICHKCDNPKCVNPEHLYEGTSKDNAIDRKNRGRGRKPKSL